jgi:WD40 repeat protein
VAFSPDGKTLLTASDDTEARLWDVASGELCGDFLQHSGQVGIGLYHPSGRQVLTVDDDGNASLWDVVPPAADDKKRLRLSIEWRSGSYIDSKRRIRRLTQAEWLDRKRELDRLGGPCDARSWDDLSAAEQDELAGKNITP